MKKYLVITTNKKLTSYLLKKNNVTLDEVFELIKNIENITDLTGFNLED